MRYEEVRYDVDDPVATITLNRPAQLNAFTTRMGTELRHALGEAERDPRVVADSFFMSAPAQNPRPIRGAGSLAGRSHGTLLRSGRYRSRNRR